MAKKNNQPSRSRSSSSSKPEAHYAGGSVEQPTYRSAIRASCYSVDSVTTALTTFHYSSTGAGGIPSPPGTPLLAATSHLEPSTPPSSLEDSIATNNRLSTVWRYSNSKRHGHLGGKGGASSFAHKTITEECERLFCETLRDLFLGEGNTTWEDSLQVMDAQLRYAMRVHTAAEVPLDTPPSSFEDKVSLQIPPRSRLSPDRISQWLEVWDYVGGNRFRGFVAKEGTDEKTMFVFFDAGIPSRDGLLALMELATIPKFDCSAIVVCLDRNKIEPSAPSSPSLDAASSTDARRSSASSSGSSISSNSSSRTGSSISKGKGDIVRDLGWIGFQPATLARWADSGIEVTSERWLFMGTDV